MHFHTRVIRLQLLLACSTLAGCASITNPVANGVPARLVPEEYLAERKGDTEPIPLTWLRRKPETIYRLAKGDILGVYIEGVLGDPDRLPPIHYPDVADLPPAVGFPIPIRDNGTVPLPLVDPINVDGMSIEEAEEVIIDAYTVKKKILKRNEARILVTLVSPRLSKILVLREDSPGTRGIQAIDPFRRISPLIPQRDRGTGNMLRLPATESDVLQVLTSTGGLPGGRGANEVIVMRGYSEDNGWPVNAANLRHHVAKASLESSEPSGGKPISNPTFVRIPLRWPRGAPPPFRPEDVILETGDIVYIPSNQNEVYYSGGLLPPREVPLPRDYDLGAIEALLRIGGPLVNGGIRGNAFSGGLVGAGLGNPSPSLLSILRQTPGGNQLNIRVNLNRALRDPRENITIKAGDVLVLQETPAEAVARYFSQVFNLNIFANDSGGRAATASGNLP